MEQRHIMIKQKDLSRDEAVLEGRGEAPDGVVMEGYLYKRASNAFKTWSRRWFSIQSNQLVYQKRAKELHAAGRLGETPAGLADGRAEQHRLAFSEGQAEPPGQHPERPASLVGGTLEAWGRSPRAGGDKRCAGPGAAAGGNAQCCDCRSPRTEWASINLGITLCIECSGIHRSLGVHFSKVRSLTLDSWEPELVKLMCELGNGAPEPHLRGACGRDDGQETPARLLPWAEKESWIRAKYVEKKFITKLPEARLSRGGAPGTPRPGTGPPGPPLKPKPGSVGRAAGQGRPAPPLKTCAASTRGRCSTGPLATRTCPPWPTPLAHGADVNWVNAAEDSRTPLLRAVAANSLLACEFLLQNGGQRQPGPTAPGGGPLHHATILGHTGLACLFLKRGANLNAVDMEGKEPLSIAIDTANADIVTLLRLAKMREGGGRAGTVRATRPTLDIFRDFSLMASDNPEKLTRRDLKLTTL
ncbi:unnamed protein product [Eretmochelys imbricata]